MKALTEMGNQLKKPAVQQGRSRMAKYKEIPLHKKGGVKVAVADEIKRLTKTCRQ